MYYLYKICILNKQFSSFLLVYILYFLIFRRVAENQSISVFVYMQFHFLVVSGVSCSSTNKLGGPVATSNSQTLESVTIQTKFFDLEMSSSVTGMICKVVTIAALPPFF